MGENTYRIRIERSGDAYEVEGDKDFVLEMLNRFESMLKATTTTPKSIELDDSIALTDELKISKKPQSIGEFVRQLGLKKHTDYVLAFGYYIEKTVGKDDFTPADINTCYYDAKMEPSNTSQMIIHNIRKGFIMEAKGTKQGGKKRYTLTRTGEEFMKKEINKKSK